MGLKSSGALLKTGLIGTTIAAICCFTPVLAVTLGIVGMGAFTGYLDYVLLPALVVFGLITLYALARKQRRAGDECCPPHRRSSN